VHALHIVIFTPSKCRYCRACV